MILIADSGSSKTDWRLIERNGNIKPFESRGLNPYFHTVSSISETVEQTFQSINQKAIEHIYFYGSGCSTLESKSIVEQGIMQIFNSAKIKVMHDLLGSARAACGKNAGLAAILGTGSNCCVYDGSEIVKSRPSGGYILGDEGGGVNLGKRLLKTYVEKDLPSDLAEALENRYACNHEEILENIYKKPYPNRYMAQFSRFIYHHREHFFIAELIEMEFKAFFDHQVLRYEEALQLPLNLVGSIAFYYHEYIRSIAAEKGVRVGTILEKPISGLSLFHQLNGQVQK